MSRSSRTRRRHSRPRTRRSVRRVFSISRFAASNPASNPRRIRRERERGARGDRDVRVPALPDAVAPPAARRAVRFILGDDASSRRSRPSARALAWSARAFRGALRDFLDDVAALEEAARRIVFPGIVGGGDGVVGDRLDRRVLADAACDALGAMFASETSEGSRSVVDAALERWALLDASEDFAGEVVCASERRRAATTRAACAYATAMRASDPNRARHAVDALANAYCRRVAKGGGGMGGGGEGRGGGGERDEGGDAGHSVALASADVLLASASAPSTSASSVLFRVCVSRGVVFLRRADARERRDARRRVVRD